MKIMTDRTTSLQIMQSMRFLSTAFQHGADAASRAEPMRDQLYLDIDLVNAVLEISGFNAPNDRQKEFMLEYMDRPAFKTMVDRVNHLTSPEMFSRLSYEVPHVAKAYWELKCSLGNLQVAVMPASSIYDQHPALVG